MVFFYCGIFITLWTIAAVMLINNRKLAYTKWVCLLLAVTGLASFSVVIQLEVLPWMRASLHAADLTEAVRVFTIAAWGTEYHFVPFLFLMCAIVFTRLFSARMLTWVGIGLFVPIAAYLATVPPLYPEARLGHPYFRILAGIYVLIGVVVYWMRYWTESNSAYKKNSLRTSITMMLCMSFLYATDYYGLNYFLIGKNELVISSNNMWQFNIIIAIVFMLFFVYYGMRYGFLGIKLRIEQQKMDYSMKNLTQGALILNHTLKNEVQKINYLSSRMKSALAQDNRDETMHYLSSLDKVADHILDMMNRIKERTGEIVLNERNERLTELLDYILRSIAPTLQEHGIELERNYQIDPLVYCDGAHIKEVLNNVLVNAVEAMGRMNGGKLNVSVLEIKRDVVIWVKDTGSGISAENAAKIFDPFFTTKKGVVNYGLGLNYCYGVLHKHGGNIRLVDTEPGKGTWMEIRFPSKRVRGKQVPDRSFAAEGGVPSGPSNKGTAC
ncbi:sensor histidine kinase [Paenibacillus montanisoli]|uniref:histidine kinase n=1 Tax=Paenibacillus montanisoli TaxID=2081970 RepID=A0A328TZC1_9BACL|nr:HAMP domain-containing sensor histidine kinase [Paenibacillus montanisoli]RAP75887.1 hypothetical protein DL346_10675 [Paenibacillus montanisoli]